MFKINFLCQFFICFSLTFASPYHSRSRTKSSSPTYDQKQTGDYNIQLHLKDFQVVALLSEGALGELGEYDYTYDYSELTQKPSTSTHRSTSTTQKEKPTSPPVSTTTNLPPTTSVAPPSTTQKQISTNAVPSSAPPLIHPSPTTVKETPSTISSTTTPPGTTTTVPPLKITSKPDIVTEITKTTVKPAVTTTTEKRIHVEVVQILKDPKLEDAIPVKDENKIDGNRLDAPNTVMPIKQSNEVGAVTNKEEMNQTEPIMSASSYRKCATGYQRDKNGRCRRVRRPAPQFPFGISRLATLASKLRQATTDGQTPNIE